MEKVFSYIDIHTHLNLEQFQEDWKEVEYLTLKEGVAYINVGTGKDTSVRAIELASMYDQGVYATVGLHPIRAGGGSAVEESEIFNPEVYKKLAEHEKVVAIGECGLDYYRVEKDTKEMQEEAFVKQIELANELDKPLMLHVRPSVDSMDAYEDALEILKKHAKVLGNVHFFVGSLEIAKQFWNMGYTTSFTGVLTFTHDYDEVVKNAPLNMIHAETDAPFVTPVPYRGERNEPLHVREVYKKIAVIRNEDEEKVRQALLQNAQRLFKITL